MECPNCQTEHREGVEFRRECGQSLQLELVCPQCRHTNPLGQKFCDKCGCRLVEEFPPAPPSPEPTSFASERYQGKRFLGEDGCPSSVEGNL